MTKPCQGISLAGPDLVLCHKYTIMVTSLNSTEITYLFEATTGMGDRFNHVLEKVRAAVGSSNDRVRMLKDMMKASLLTYVQKTHDAPTGRQIFHKAIMAGSDTMLTVTAATMLANALAGSHADQAESLLKGIAAKLSGKHEMGMWENASGAAVSVGATTAPNGKKQKMRRRDSIFAEDEDWDINHDENDPVEQAAWRKMIHKKYPGHLGGRVDPVVNPPLDADADMTNVVPFKRKQTESYLNWDDLQERPDMMQKLVDVVDLQEDKVIANILVDPVTAELILAVRESLTPGNQRRYEAMPLNEMIQIAYRAVQRGLIQVVMEDG